MMKNLLLVALVMAVEQVAAAAGDMPTFHNNQHLTFGIGSWDMSLLNYYVSSGIVAGIVVFLSIILTFLFATCQLMAVQAPPIFLDKSIDWGKQQDNE
jgi:hypothetical protein